MCENGVTLAPLVSASRHNAPWELEFSLCASSAASQRDIAAVLTLLMNDKSVRPGLGSVQAAAKCGPAHSTAFSCRLSRR